MYRTGRSDDQYLGVYISAEITLTECSSISNNNKKGKQRPKHAHSSGARCSSSSRNTDSWPFFAYSILFMGFYVADRSGYVCFWQPPAVYDVGQISVFIADNLIEGNKWHIFWPRFFFSERGSRKIEKVWCGIFTFRCSPRWWDHSVIIKVKVWRIIINESFWSIIKYARDQ